MKHLITILIFFCVSFGFSQDSELIGTFWADSTHYVKISSNDTIEFFSEYGCCLLTEVYGIGTYEIRDSTLTITTAAPKSTMSSNYQIIRQLDQLDKIQLAVKDSGEPVKFCNVLIKNKLTQEIVMGASTTEMGFVEFTTTDIDLSESLIIEFSSLGLDSFSMNLLDVVGRSVMVDLKPFRVVRDRIVEFKIRREFDSIQFIGPIFPDSEDETMSGKDKMRMVFKNWPWNWNFSYTHAAI
ncbi:MAG: hypothetical protein WBG42_15070, partial [Cryomorphaceae bacterium]